MAQIPHANPGLTCPLWQKDMSEVCHKCPWWTLVRGKNPQSEEEIDRWDCAVGFLPLLLIEGAQQSRQVGAAVQGFRDEFVKVNQLPLLMQLAGGNKLLPKGASGAEDT